MAWNHLDIDKPHVAYMILGGFTSLFMLCSLFVKEKLYIGEATVATLCGIIFGPHAANLFNPNSWGNVDKITLECSRVVLVVQCFAVGVELPKAYMERHWRSVALLLVPVMTWGFFVTSLFIWWMVPTLDWLESLVCAACVTATDPVLASSVVGKGKFAKRVPKHLRDVLSAESGCNDGMAFPFIYLAFYILRYKPDAGQVASHWICITILYECAFGAVYGFLVGYIARHAIKFAERKQLIDRESFLVFYFVLALFCAGSGSLLGMDDLLIGFSAGVGFSNDGWFTEKTEESHVSNVIDLLLNLAYFVYFGSIIPWQMYNAPEIGLVPWRLVVIALLVIFFRRIPAMLLLKPIIPDVKTWREALFAGHFGPIGVGAIFASLLARAELENHNTQPLAQGQLPGPGQRNYYVVQVIWPLTTFLVISSILVHGSSIAVFTLGKHINTLTITLSYTTANEEGPSWMNRLPRVQSLARGSMSFRKAEDTEDSSAERLPVYSPGNLPPTGMPGNFLRRVRDEDTDAQSWVSSRRPHRRKGRRIAGAGGPISQSAIAPQRREQPSPDTLRHAEDEAMAEKQEAESEAAQRGRIDREGSPRAKERERFGREPEIEVYQEGHDMVIEDEEGNVLKTEDISHESREEQEQHVEEERRKLEADQTGKLAKSKGHPHEKTEGEDIQRKVGQMTGSSSEQVKKRFGKWGLGKERTKAQKREAVEEAVKQKPRSAHAYQFGNTIIVEDEDGEVIKKYTIPSADKSEAAGGDAPPRRGLTRMGTWRGKKESAAESSQAAERKARRKGEDEDGDDGLRFTLARNQDVDEKGVNIKGRRMNKQEFIRQIQQLDPKARREVVEQTDAPEPVKEMARSEAKVQEAEEHKDSAAAMGGDVPPPPDRGPAVPVDEEESTDDYSAEELGDTGDGDDDGSSRPSDDVATSLARLTAGSAAQARRRRYDDTETNSPRLRPRRRDSDDDGTERIPPAQLRGVTGPPRLSAPRPVDLDDSLETPAERKRRLAALGELQDSDDSENAIEESDSDDNGEFRSVRGKIQFADGTKPAESKTVAGRVSYGGGGESARSEAGSGAASSAPATASASGGRRGHRARISWGGESGREKK